MHESARDTSYYWLY